MAVEWSDDIILAVLTDEPDLSDELTSVLKHVDKLVGSEQGVDKDVVLNFADVTYLNSSNIAQLLRLRKSLVEAGRSIVLCSLRDPVWSTMMLTGLDKVFRFAPDTATGIASIQLAEEEGAGPHQ